VWTTTRDHCKGLLGEEDYYRYYELCEEEVFDFIYKVEDNRLIEWKKLLDRFYPKDEDVRSSDYKAEIAFRDDFEDNLKVMRERVSSARSLLLVPRGQACSDSSLSRVSGECIILWCLHAFLFQ